MHVYVHVSVLQAGYRSAIHEAVPQLKVLDDVPLTEEGESRGGEDASCLTSRSTLFAVSEAGVESDWRLVQQSIKQSATSLTQLERDTSIPIGETTAHKTMGEQERERERQTIFLLSHYLYPFQQLSHQDLF